MSNDADAYPRRMVLLRRNVPARTDALLDDHESMGYEDFRLLLKHLASKPLQELCRAEARLHEPPVMFDNDPWNRVRDALVAPDDANQADDARIETEVYWYQVGAVIGIILYRKHDGIQLYDVILADAFALA